MYIIKTISKSKKDSSQNYYTYRLMESQRIGKKVKKITLLNLGSDFNVEKQYWKILSKRVEEIINRTPALFECDKDIETQAQHLAMRLIALKAKCFPVDDNSDEKEEEKYKEIDTTTVLNSDSKNIGIEHIVYETIKELQLDAKLKELDFTNIQLNSAIGSLVAKIAHPSSDIKSHRWLC